MVHFKQMINWHWLLVGGTSVSLHLRLFMGYLFVFMTTGSFLLGKEFKRERGRSYHVFYDLSLEDMVSPSFLPYSSLNAGWPYLMWEETLRGVNTRGYLLPRSLTLFSLCVPYSSFKPQRFFFFLSIYYLFIYLAVQGLSCGLWDLVPRPGIKPRAPALRAQSLSHWTTRGVPKLQLLSSSPVRDLLQQPNLFIPQLFTEHLSGGKHYSRCKDIAGRGPTGPIFKNTIYSELPWWSDGWESTCQGRGHRFDPWPRKIPHAAGN